MTYGNILYDEKEKVGIITLNRPETCNAISLELMKEVISCLNKAAETRTIKVMIIKAAGVAFSSGHDFKNILGSELNDVRHLSIPVQTS